MIVRCSNSVRLKLFQNSVTFFLQMAQLFIMESVSDISLLLLDHLVREAGRNRNSASSQIFQEIHQVTARQPATIDEWFQELKEKSQTIIITGNHNTRKLNGALKDQKQCSSQAESCMGLQGRSPANNFSLYPPKNKRVFLYFDFLIFYGVFNMLFFGRYFFS